MRRLALFLFLLWLSACAGAPSHSSDAARDATVLLISLDGTPPSAVESLPFFERVAREGAWSERLEPVLPSNTFPNHVTFVTGVGPDRHGIVNNRFRDPERGTYSYESDPTWLEVEPLWSQLAAVGVVSASYHWVGSEGAWRSGRGPLHWRPFAERASESAKVEQILAWLALEDPAVRPRFVTAWFRGGDASAHRFGPGDRSVTESLEKQSAALARLVDALGAGGHWATTTLLLVSDHGMARVERTVDLARALQRAGVAARVAGGGGCALVRMRRSGDPLEPALEVARSLGLHAWRRGERAAGWPLNHPRFGDVFVMAPVGTAIVRHRGFPGIEARAGRDPLTLRGSHGYDPAAPEMGALFAALGRGVAPGARLGAVRAIDVAPTVLALLGRPVPDWMEGRPLDLGGAM